MEFAYGDILKLQRPVHDNDIFSRRHPKMTRLNRAKLFAPFAALAGFDDAAHSKEICYVPRRIPDADEAYALNRALNALHRATWCGALARHNRVVARVEYFVVCDDVNSEAYGRMGLYHTETGIVWRVDPVKQALKIGERVIPFSDICAITDLEGKPMGGQYDEQ